MSLYMAYYMDNWGYVLSETTAADAVKTIPDKFFMAKAVSRRTLICEVVFEPF